MSPLRKRQSFDNHLFSPFILEGKHLIDNTVLIVILDIGIEFTFRSTLKDNLYSSFITSMR